MPSDEDVLNTAVGGALKLMRDSGFEVSSSLEVMVDPELPFMGYTGHRRSGHIIVVSGGALKSGMVEGLLIHEMCHVYRTDMNHLSHNQDLVSRFLTAVINENKLTEHYQIRTIHEAINHIQDLYADDIAFEVFSKTTTFKPEQIRDFFLDWIDETPPTPRDVKERWMSIGRVLNNCFVISNLERHKVEDIHDKAEKKIQRFLSRAYEETRREFQHFRELMTNLKENIDEEQFEKDLTEYLTRIIELAKQNIT